jgi:integrase/recombinase XerD
MTNACRGHPDRTPIRTVGTLPLTSLHAGIDTSIIALWLGHVSVDTTQIYLHADLEIKQRALARTRPPNSHAGRYQPPDQLLTWLEAL